MLLWGGEKNFEFRYGGILVGGILVGGILVFGWESTKPATDHPPLIPWHCLHRIFTFSSEGRQTGIEPATFRITTECSNQLNYCRHAFRGSRTHNSVRKLVSKTSAYANSARNAIKRDGRESNPQPLDRQSSTLTN